MEHLVKLHEHEYELSESIMFSSQKIRFFKSPILVATFVEFLNAISHQENCDSDSLINIVNYDVQLYYENERWCSKLGEENKPITLVTYRAAEEFASLHSLQIVSEELWRYLLKKERSYINTLDSSILNIEERYGGITAPNKKDRSSLGIEELIGNISFWGYSLDDYFASCLGVGWNKSRYHLKYPFLKNRWKKIGSVSNGLRYCKVS